MIFHITQKSNYLIWCYLRLRTRSSCKDFPISTDKTKPLESLLLKSESHPAILNSMYEVCVSLQQYDKIQKADYVDDKLTSFSERSRTDMLEETLRRVTKRAFAEVRPRRLSDSFNEHRDLVAAPAWKMVNT